jgi:hypothetical protein
MEFTIETPRKQRTIGGHLLSVIQPFADGQTLTPATAAMLNQTLAENFSNNMRKAVDGKTQDEAQALLETYMSEYEPGVRTSGTAVARTIDPVEREARKIAREEAVRFVKASNLKTTDVVMPDIIEQVYLNNIEALHNQAKTIIKAKTKAAEGSALVMPGLGQTPEPAAA